MFYIYPICPVALKNMKHVTFDENFVSACWCVVNVKLKKIHCK